MQKNCTKNCKGDIGLEYIVDGDKWADKLEELIVSGKIDRDAQSYIEFTPLSKNLKAVLTVISKNQVNIKFRKEEETC